MNAIGPWASGAGAQRVYMRSLATREFGSEISAALPDVIAACKVAGFDLVIVDNTTAPNIPAAGKMEALA